MVAMYKFLGELQEFFENVQKFLQDSWEVSGNGTMAGSKADRDHLVEVINRLKTEASSLLTQEGACSTLPVKGIPHEENYTTRDPCEGQMEKPEQRQRDESYDNLSADRQMEQRSPESTNTLIEVTDLEDIEISGHLKKQNEAPAFFVLQGRSRFFITEQNYWCAINDGVLHYFDGKTGKHKGHILIKGYQASGVDKKNAIFQLTCPDKKSHFFAAENESDMHRWITYINTGKPPVETAKPEPLQVSFPFLDGRKKILQLPEVCEDSGTDNEEYCNDLDKPDPAITSHQPQPTGNDKLAGPLDMDCLYEDPDQDEQEENSTDEEEEEDYLYPVSNKPVLQDDLPAYQNQSHPVGSKKEEKSLDPDNKNEDQGPHHDRQKNDPENALEMKTVPPCRDTPDPTGKTTVLTPVSDVPQLPVSNELHFKCPLPPKRSQSSCSDTIKTAAAHMKEHYDDGTHDQQALISKNLFHGLWVFERIGESEQITPKRVYMKMVDPKEYMPEDSGTGKMDVEVEPAAKGYLYHMNKQVE